MFMSIAQKVTEKAKPSCASWKQDFMQHSVFKVTIKLIVPLSPLQSVIVSPLLVLPGDQKHVLCGFKGREAPSQALSIKSG